MDAVSRLRGLLRSWWLIILVTLAGGVGGFVVYFTATPQYASTVTVAVASESPKADEASARALTELRAGTISSVVATDPVLDAAALEAGRGNDMDGVSASASTNGAFITVRVAGPNAEVVRDVADAYPAVLPEQTDDLVGESGTPFGLNVVTPANLPGSPFQPILTTNVGLGLVAGLVIGLALAVLRETLNRTVRSSEQLAEVTGLTVLGVVPRDLPKEPLPASTHPRSARAEAYRQIRTTVMNATERRPLVIAVTSATVGEGKTSVSTNLAVVLSRAGHRVALIDGDLRRPKVADFFGLDTNVGLTDVLTGAVPLEQALLLRDDDRLGVLPAGSIPANPSEALAGAAMRDVLLTLSNSYEFIVIDTPPVLPVTDALVLAPLVDGMLLVSRLGYTTRERVERALAGVDRVNGTLLGVVPNQASRGTDADYSYSYTYKSTAEPTGSVDVEHAERPSSGGRHSGSRPVIPVEGTVPTAPTTTPTPGDGRA